MIHLALKNVKKYYGSNLVLKEINFEVLVKEKVGVVGRNGTGKSTLFKIIKGLEGHDEGQLSIKKDTTIGYLDQIPVFPDHYTVKDVLDTAFGREFNLLKDMGELEVKMADAPPLELERILKTYGEIQQQYSALGGYDMEEKLSRVSDGLKITEAMKKRNFNSLSGGEKTRILLGKILLQTCDLLLLDEPSNHLDMDSIEWLEGYIRDYAGSILIISHDRFFLDETVTKIIEIEDGACEVYLGNYSYYSEEKNRRLLQALEDYNNQQKKIKAMEESIKRIRDWANRGDNEKLYKQAASIQKRLDKIDRIKRPVLEGKKMQVKFSTEGHSGKDVLFIQKLRKSFGDLTILDGLDFHLRAKEKVGILGKNGSGKTTLFKLITGDYGIDAGELKVGSNAKIGYLQQNLTFPNENQTILETLQESSGLTTGEARSILARFLFYGEDVFKRVGSLSGGERSRLRLCQLMHQDINTLILDEPTNHLDIESREMLEETLEEFNGTILFISHDRYFINALAEKVYELDGGSLTEYAGNYSYYRQKKLELLSIKDATSGKKDVAYTGLKEGKKSKQVCNQPDAKRPPSKGNKFKLKDLENRIAQLEMELVEVDGEMLKNTSDYVVIQELQNRRDLLQQELDQLLELWIEL